MKMKLTTCRQLLLSGLNLSFLLLFASAALAKNAYVSVIKDGTNIRTSPSSKGEVHGEVFAGFPLQILQSKGEWAKVVDFEGDEGWVHNTMISPRKSVIVKAKKASLREAPTSNEDNQVVVVARYGVIFTPIESRGEWLKVRYEDGTEGWVSNEQIWPAMPFDSSGGKTTPSASTKSKKQSPARAIPKKRSSKSQKKQRHH
ncbi:MAG: SH3 domain-containing protein [Desulfobulbaceae bacterium]|nr:SH3 domain-containing protein [Desulfobulbaceae bacterium]